MPACQASGVAAWTVLDAITSERLIPAGGAVGDVLSKSSGDDYATTWAPAVSDETDPIYSASPAAGIGAQDIADWGTAVGWGDHALAGYLLPGVDAAVLGSDTATAGYAPLADGAGGIAWGPVATSTATYAPTAMTVTYGTLDSGTVASLAEKDGTNVAIAEASGANALQVTLDFAGLSSFSSIEIFGRYAGSTSHQIAVEVWDYADSVWEVYGYLPSTATPEWHFYTIADPFDHVSGGAAQIRLRHVQSGNASHDLYLDYVALSAAISGGVIAHADIAGREVADAHPASAIANSPAGNIAATTVQAAVDELDAEKVAPPDIVNVYVITVTGEIGAIGPLANAHRARFPLTGNITVTDIVCSVNTAPTLGYIEIDIKASGVSLFSTPITIDQGEVSSLTAAAPPVLSDTGLTYDEPIAVDIVAAGIDVDNGNGGTYHQGDGDGLKCALYGVRAP